MPVNMEIQVDDAEVQRFLRAIQGRVRNPSPVMRQIAGILRNEAAQAFRKETGPATGQAWPPLSPVTKARRAKQGKTGKMLQVKGDLKRSIHQESGRDYAAAGTNLVYARTHQFGAKRGAFGSWKGRPLPWGDIPARPFLGLSPRGRNAILDKMRDWLERAARR